MNTTVYAFNLNECILKCDSVLTDKQQILPKGNLVQIKYENGNYKAKKFDNNITGAELLGDEYSLCNLYDFIVINENLWFMLLAIPNFDNRMSIMESDNHRNFLSKLKVGIDCIVSERVFGKQMYLKCTIQYVGPVPEIRPGYFFGLLLNVSHHTYNTGFINKLKLCLL